MKRIGQGFDFYIDSSIHVALSVCSLTWITYLACGIEPQKSLVWLIFFASIVGYNFVKYFGVAKRHHKKGVPWLNAIQKLSVCSLLLVCALALKLRLETLLCMVVLTAATLLYTIPLLPSRSFFGNRRNLRSVGGLKVHLIAFVWMGMTVLVPVVNSKHIIDNYILLIALQRYVFIVVLMLPFEIRDLQYDNLTLSTIPQKVGIWQTKVIGALLLMLFVLLEFLKHRHTTTVATPTVAIMLVTLVLLVASRKKQSRYYSAFWVEALPILWLLMIQRYS